MQSCASNLSSDTPTELPAFYKAKHANILPLQAQRDNFASCFSQQSSILVGAQDFEASSTFGELLTQSHRSLRTAVRGLFRAIAISLGSVGESEDPSVFETRTAKAVFGDKPQVDELCSRLSSVMPIFGAAEAAFRTQIAKPACTVKDAIDKSIEG